MSVCKNQSKFICFSILVTRFVWLQESVYVLSLWEYWSQVLSVYKNQSRFICGGILITSSICPQESVYVYLCGNIDHKFCPSTRISLIFFLCETTDHRFLSVCKNRSQLVCARVSITNCVFCDNRSQVICIWVSIISCACKKSSQTYCASIDSKLSYERYNVVF